MVFVNNVMFSGVLLVVEIEIVVYKLVMLNVNSVIPLINVKDVLKDII